MQLNPLIITTVAIGLSIILLGLIMKYLKQPYVVAYILAGVLIGSSGLNLVTDQKVVSYLGDVGIILLLFFVGMELSLPKLLSNWKVAVFGTLGQIFVTILLSVFLGNLLGWPIERSILISFVIVLSSTAVVLKILEEKNELDTKIGQNVISVTIVQDIAVIPMMLLLTFLSNRESSFSNNYLPIIGTVFFVSLLILVVRKESFNLPVAKLVRNDHELQLFIALMFCFGLAMISAILGLSAALGAFVAGIIISRANDTKWVKETLHPFKILFLALFFVYVGLLIDLNFILQNYLLILLWVAFIFIINTVITTLIFLSLKNSLKESLYVAAILAQAGEFGFILASIGLAGSIITLYDYNLAISVISLTLLLSPLWIAIIGKVMHIDRKYIADMHRRYIRQLRSNKEELIRKK